MNNQQINYLLNDKNQKNQQKSTQSISKKKKTPMRYLINNNMISKYLLFTLVVSILPLIIIVRDMEITYKMLNTFSTYINTYYKAVNFDFVNKVLSSGVFSFIATNLSEDSVKKVKSNIIFTKEELKVFNGKQGNPMYLAILGNVFDVSKAGKYYGPGETYNVFTGD